MIHEEKIAPTAEAIDAWRAREKKSPDGSHRYWLDGPSFGVNIWTKAGSCRCITSRAEWTDGADGYWTIRGEGSSNTGRETAIRAEHIVRAVGVIIGDADEIAQLLT